LQLRRNSDEPWFINRDVTLISPDITQSSFQSLSDSMSNEILELFCHILGDPQERIFPVKIASTESVGGLKKAIKAEKSPEFDAFAADALDLYQVSIPIHNFDAKLANARSPEEVEGSAKLHPLDELQECLSSPLKKHIHVILQRPKGECKSLVEPHR
jgi:hypothetical protein